MKIISGYKDYYDYLIGIYGQDEKLILDRREYNYIRYMPIHDDVYTFHIGEYMIDAFYTNNKFHFGESVRQFSSENKLAFLLERDYSDKEYWSIPLKNRTMFCLKSVKYLGDKSPTWKEDCPILLGKKNFQKFPILKEYNVSSLLDAHTVWQYLTDWLSKRITKNENNIEPISDKVKIVSAGFDLKTSFRK
jgi:hypothetical protein